MTWRLNIKQYRKSLVIIFTSGKASVNPFKEYLIHNHLTKIPSHLQVCVSFPGIQTIQKEKLVADFI